MCKQFVWKEQVLRCWVKSDGLCVKEKSNRGEMNRTIISQFEFVGR